MLSKPRKMLSQIVLFILKIALKTYYLSWTDAEIEAREVK